MSRNEYRPVHYGKKQAYLHNYRAALAIPHYMRQAKRFSENKTFSMLVRVLYHDHCFDGAASAAFVTRFLQKEFFNGADFEYTGLAHRADQLFADSLFDGDVNVIVDFKYSPHPKVTWWFDHAETASEASLDRIGAMGGALSIQNRMMFQGSAFCGSMYGQGSLPLTRRIIRSAITCSA